MSQLLSNPNWVLVTLLCLMVSTCIAAFMRPKYSLVLFFLWVPFADLGKRLLWLPPEATPSWAEYQIALLIPDLVLIAGMIRAGYDLFIAKSLHYRFSWMDVPIGVYCIWSLINVFNPHSSLYAGLVGFKSSSLYILVYVLFRLYMSESVLRQLSIIILVTAGVAAIYALAQVLWGFSSFELAWLASGLSELGGGGQGVGPTISLFGINRPFSTFASHEQLGWYLGFSLLLISAHPSLKWRHWAAIVLIIFALARTLSRSAWAFTFVGLGIILALSLYFRLKPLVCRAIAIILVFSIGYFSFGYIARIQSENDAVQTQSEDDAFSRRAVETGTYEWRIFSFQALWEDPSWHTPFGNGTGSMWYAWRLDEPGTENPSATEVRELGPLGLPEGKRILSHIGTIDIIYELGIVGFAFFAWAVGAALLFGLQTLREKTANNRRQWTIVAAATISGVVIANSLVATVLIFRPVAAFFWLMFGVIESMRFNVDKDVA